MGSLIPMSVVNHQFWRRMCESTPMLRCVDRSARAAESQPVVRRAVQLKKLQLHRDSAAWRIREKIRLQKLIETRANAGSRLILSQTLKMGSARLKILTGWEFGTQESAFTLAFCRRELSAEAPVGAGEPGLLFAKLWPVWHVLIFS